MEIIYNYIINYDIIFIILKLEENYNVIIIIARKANKIWNNNDGINGAV